MEEPTLSNDEITTIRKRVSALQKAKGYTRARIALDAGLPNSTFSQFMSDKYEGDIVRPARALKKYLQNHAENEALTKKIGQDSQFVKTNQSERITHVLRYCLVAGDMGAVMGVPGMGKSETAVEFVSQNAHAHYLSVSPSCGNIAPMLGRLVGAMKRETYSLHARQLRAVLDSSLVPGSLIIIDEAQHLSGGALEELRAIHDDNKCGLVMMGNHTVVTRLNSPARAAQFAQLTSRIGMKYTMPTMPSPEDVRLIANSVYEFGEPEIQYLIKLSKKHGALRTVVKTIKLARMLTPGTKKPTGLDELQAAHSQLS